MSAFSSLATAGPQMIWDGLLGRSLHGERVTLALLELEPSISVPAHEHDNEQAGLLVEGEVSFTVGDETRELRPGDAWCIPPHVTHSLVCGPDGAVIVEVFAPPRSDWGSLERLEPGPGRWP